MRGGKKEMEQYRKKGIEKKDRKKLDPALLYPDTKL